MHQDLFQAGRRLPFTTDSALYSDVYEAEILAVHPDRIDLHLSFHRGYLLLLPVGTRVRWLPPGLPGAGLTSRVIARNTAEKTWSVTLPAPDTARPRKTRVLAVGSGKGGVGKTTFCINAGLALMHCRQRVILLDADIGLANVEVLLGLHSSRNLTDVIQGGCTLADILTEGPGGIRILPGSSGISSLTRLDSLQFNRIISGFAELEADCDVLILDTGAGLSELVLKFLESADEFLLLTNPEPHAVMDGYYLTKVLSQRNPRIRVNLIVNRCESDQEARQCSDAFINATRQFLGVTPVYLGWLPYNQMVPRSLKKKSPLFLSHPQADYSRSILSIAQKLVGLPERQDRQSGLKAFWSRLKKSWLDV
ncbi:MAG: MinD/ParA family ATP-binding protein [Bacillota bacterium]